MPWRGRLPATYTTQLKCGQLVGTGDGYAAALSFTADQLTREINEAVCLYNQHGCGRYYIATRKHNWQSMFYVSISAVRLAGI